MVLSLGSCTIARIPVVIGYIGGASVSRKKALFITSAFVIGLMVSYSCIGLLLGFFSYFIAKHILIWSTYIYYFLGIVLIFAGICLLRLIKFKFPLKCDLTKKPLFMNLGTWGAFLMGAVFGFFEAPACPCCGPVIFVMAGLTFAKGRPLAGLTLFLTYALGSGIPLLIAGNSMAVIKHIHRGVEEKEEYIRIFSGVLLFCLGVYFLWMA